MRLRRTLWSNAIVPVIAAAAIASLFLSNERRWHVLLIIAIGVLAGARWLTHATRTRDPMAVSFGVYAVLVCAAIAIKEGSSRPPRVALAVLTGATVAAGLAGLGFLMRERRQRKELDRVLVSEATAAAFAVTVLALVTSGLLEALVGLKPLSAWYFFAIGGVTWSLAHTYFRRKYS